MEVWIDQDRRPPAGVNNSTEPAHCTAAHQAWPAVAAEVVKAINMSNVQRILQSANDQHGCMCMLACKQSVISTVGTCCALCCVRCHAGPESAEGPAG